MQKQTQRPLHFGRTHDQNLEAFCRGISLCWAGDNPKQPSSHRHCYQYQNGSKQRFSNLLNDSVNKISILFLYHILSKMNYFLHTT